MHANPRIYKDVIYMAQPELISEMEKQALKERIMRSFQDQWDRKPESRYAMLGNFPQYFSYNDEGENRFETAMRELPNSGLARQYREKPKPEEYPNNWSVHSDLWKSKTFADFLADIKQAAKDEGLSEQLKMSNQKDIPRGKHLQHNVKLLLPVYIRLRQQGYLPDDLSVYNREL